MGGRPGGAVAPDGRDSGQMKAASFIGTSQIPQEELNASQHFSALIITNAHIYINFSDSFSELCSLFPV